MHKPIGQPLPLIRTRTNYAVEIRFLFALERLPSTASSWLKLEPRRYCQGF